MEQYEMKIIADFLEKRITYETYKYKMDTLYDMYDYERIEWDTM
jgi:hypothetical protein